MGAPAATAPDVVRSVVAYLNAALTPPVSSKTPSDRPTTFVTVRRTGGVMATRVSDGAQLTIECWAGSDISAFSLATEVRTLLQLMADGTNRDGVVVYRVVEFSGPAYQPDTASQQDRVRWTVQVHARDVASTTSS